MKTCTGCQKSLTEDSFAWRSKAKGERVTRCKSCVNIYNQGHYQRNREVYSAKARAWEKRNNAVNQQNLIGYFKDHPCIDCGESDFEVLQFDHRVPANKSFNVTARQSSMNWTQIAAEIEKCDVRCGNCHIRRTNRQFGYWRYALLA